MLRASISYDTNGAASHVITMDMVPTRSPLREWSDMSILVTTDAPDGQAHPICKLIFEAYRPWSEAPETLALRSLHTLVTKYPEDIPMALLEPIELSMGISMEYSADGGKFHLLRYLPEPSPFTADLPGHMPGKSPPRLPTEKMPFSNAAPIEGALKMLAATHTALVDLDGYPHSDAWSPSLSSGAVTPIGDGAMPSFAQKAFGIFAELKAREGSNAQNDLAVNHDWHDFLEV